MDRWLQGQLERHPVPAALQVLAFQVPAKKSNSDQHLPLTL